MTNSEEGETTEELENDNLSCQIQDKNSLNHV
jgi:hypothetical protein